MNTGKFLPLYTTDYNVMYRTGQIREKLTDERLRQLLDQISEKTTKTTTVHFDRRRAAIDSDSD